MADVNIRKTDGIILRRYPLRETSLLLILYTKDFGKVKGVIKGIRGPRAQFGSFPEILTLNRIVFYEGKKRDFFYISQCDLIDLFGNIRSDLVRTGYASYIIELTEAVAPFNDKNEDLFTLLFNSLKLLCTSGSAKRVARIFEIKLLLILGLMPAMNSCIQCGKKPEPGVKFSVKLGGLICKGCSANDKAALEVLPGTINFIAHIEKSSYKRASMIKVSKKVGEEVENILRRFLDVHIDRRLKTRDFLEKIEKVKL